MRFIEKCEKQRQELPEKVRGTIYLHCKGKTQKISRFAMRRYCTDHAGDEINEKLSDMLFFFLFKSHPSICFVHVQLAEAGVLQSHFVGLCTISNSRLWKHRPSFCMPADK